MQKENRKEYFRGPIQEFQYQISKSFRKREQKIKKKKIISKIIKQISHK